METLKKNNPEPRLSDISEANTLDRLLSTLDDKTKEANREDAIRQQVLTPKRDTAESNKRTVYRYFSLLEDLVDREIKRIDERKGENF